MISNAVTNLDARKQVDTREVYDTQEEQLAYTLRNTINMVFWETHTRRASRSRIVMLNVADLVSEGLEEQL